MRLPKPHSPMFGGGRATQEQVPRAGAKIVPGVFALVHVAAALPKGRSEAARAVLTTLVDEAKRTVVLQKAIDA